MPNEAAIIGHTKRWLSSVVIAHNFCPFAKREFDLGRIHYEVIEAAEVGLQLERLALECAKLGASAAIETTLLIFPRLLDDFDDYLDLLDMANGMIQAQGYEGIYQLASFHPSYRFEGTGEDDAQNYTNRSPYPMLHILREASVEAVLKTYSNPETIPQRNIALTETLGADTLRAMLESCQNKLST
ncbi:DUF1415 domain-containing protein [Hellea balneolensis]|uniref:DUF1415 domain-containing protein n=1 Tax=Hellea balneolensis TaxID=287478 RepID=UPI0003FE0C43|nr:DUF1415 domain-containing protein [Hellea balneolensis]